jgi:hypothetical protein
VGSRLRQRRTCTHRKRARVGTLTRLHPVTRAGPAAIVSANVRPAARSNPNVKPAAHSAKRSAVRGTQHARSNDRNRHPRGRVAEGDRG